MSAAAGTTRSSSATAIDRSCTRRGARTPRYFGRALYLGRSGHEGFGCDNTEGATRRARPHGRAAPRPRHRSRRPARLAVVQGPMGPTRSRASSTARRGRTPRTAGTNRCPGRRGCATQCRDPRRRRRGRRRRVAVLRHGRVRIDAARPRVPFADDDACGRDRNRRARDLAGTPHAVVTGDDNTAQRAACDRTDPAGWLRVWRDHPLHMLWVGLVYIPVAIVSSMIQFGILAPAVRRPLRRSRRRAQRGRRVRRRVRRWLGQPPGLRLRVCRRGAHDRSIGVERPRQPARRAAQPGRLQHLWVPSLGRC